MQRGADPMIGRVLDGRYLVDAKVARGGMASVYRAHDLRLDRVCAVKIMHSDLGDDHDFAARFVREAHAAARLSHPNVVSVSDQGDDDGVLFLVMEYVPGRTLRDVIRDEAPMSPARALALVEPVLLALAEAHRCGLVHRDIKPENVLIADDGRVKVADFGLARAFDANTQHTATGGLLIGTVSYLAPELIVDGRADPRSDVYASGVLLYELLTGRKPHEGEGAIQIAFKHVNEDVPPPSQATGRPLPAYLDALVLRATARDRDHRPADAKVFLHQVRRVRAAVEAGDETDAELTADLMPTATLPAVEGIDYGDEAVLQPPPAERTLESPTVGAEEQDEPTTVIGQVAGGGGRPDAAALGAAAGGHSGSWVRLSERHPARTVAAGSPGPGGPDPGSPNSPGPGSRHSTGPAPPPTPAGPGRPRGGDRSQPQAPGAAPAPRRSRRSRRGPLLLLVLVLVTVGLAYAGWWLGIGRYTSTPGVINLPVAAATERAESAGLELEVTGREFSETVTAGSVISTDPEAGAQILEGGTVEVVVSRGPERYEVPALVGKRFGRVEELLSGRNLELGEVARVWHEQVGKGVVISVSPEPGTELRRGDTVDVRVSKGPQPIEIPDFTGKAGGRAEKRLTALGFEVELSEKHSDDVPKGRVISQTPAEGTGFRGDTVSVAVSLGPVMVEVPGVRTMSVEEATETLEDVGLRIAVVRTEFYIALDRVVRQDPGSGESIPRGDVVTVYVV